ncbi:hypothetical protein DNK47_03240 [Mycoplasma wenyonii]|uniref:Uncharacterized protein n=1 Tax=Mycoplasma wenyonii TaxID=65123 RepID=A0A328PJW5_9MOLU|nr:hypothetical protein [Mycoplasma wenyonii]RAO94774.1 hypothetical protein DNK47_03240 [Mycoplasma wenyonii]
MAVTALLGKIALVAIAGGAVGSAVAFSAVRTLNAPPSSQKVKLESKEDYRKHCLLVTSDGDRKVILLACPRDFNSDKTDFYLYKKEGSSFDEVESWKFQSSHQLIVKTIKDSRQETISLAQNKNFEQLNDQKLKNICTIDWSNKDSVSSKQITCNSWTTRLNSLEIEDPERE